MTFKFSADRFELFLNEAAGPAAQRRIFVEEAKRLRDEGLARNRRALGVNTPYTQFVDGAEGAPLESVKLDGVIVFRYDIGFTAAQFAVSVLREVSPYDPTPDGKPHYRDRHFVVVDDAIVDPPYDTIRGFERMLIINDRVYTRKLEARYGVYGDLAYPAVRRELRRNFDVRFGFDDYFDERYPALIIRPK